MLGPDEALQRARAICENSIDLSQGLRRRVALRAAPLFANGGEVENATRALELGICKLPPGSVRWPDMNRFRNRADGPGFFSLADMRRLLAPALLVQGEHAVALRAALETNMLAWLTEERSRPIDLVRALCVLGMRCHEAVDQAALTRIALALSSREDVLDNLPLWVADLCLLAGLGEQTVAIEEQLLADGKLFYNRCVPTLKRMLEADGPARALEQGTAYGDGQRVDGLLMFLSEAASATGDQELSQQLQEAGAADAAAKQRLEEMDKAEKAAAEAIAAAKKSTRKGSSPASTMMRAIPLKLIGP